MIAALGDVCMRKGMASYALILVPGEACRYRIAPKT